MATGSKRTSINLTIVFRFMCQLTRFNEVIFHMFMATDQAFRFRAVIDLICIIVKSDNI